MSRDKMYVVNGLLGVVRGCNGVLTVTGKNIVRCMPLSKDKRLWPIVKSKNLHN